MSATLDWVGPPWRPANHSAWREWHDCPRKYWHSRVHCDEADPELRAINYDRGTIFHQRMADLLGRLTPSSALWPSGVGCVQPEKWSKSLEQMWTSATQWLYSLAPRLRLAKKEGWPGGTETPIQLDFYGRVIQEVYTPIPNAGIAIRGTLDWWGFDGMGGAWVFDWKTGRKRRKSILPDGSIDLQLQVYAWLLWSLYPELKSIKATFFNVRWTRPEPWVSVPRQAIAKLGTFSRRLMREVEELNPKKKDEWVAKPGNACNFCEFQKHCQVGQQFLAGASKVA